MPCARSSAKPWPLTSGFGIVHRRHDAGNAGLDDAARARTGAARVAARLERDVQRRAAARVAGLLERDDLGMRFTRPRMAALPNHDAVGDHDHGADQRVGRGHALGPPRMKQRAPHVVGVAHHFSWKIASTYSRGENGSRSSTPSPTPM